MADGKGCAEGLLLDGDLLEEGISSKPRTYGRMYQRTRTKDTDIQYLLLSKHLWPPT